MMAARIAHVAPGYGNPWSLTFGHWQRILEVLPDVVGEKQAMIAGAIQEGTSGQENTMRIAKAISRGNARRGRRMEIINSHRGKSK